MKEEKDRLMEGLWMLYQAEGVLRNISIEQFCMNNDVNFYFVKFFESIAAGRTDYENLLPTIISFDCLQLCENNKRFVCRNNRRN